MVPYNYMTVDVEVNGRKRTAESVKYGKASMNFLKHKSKRNSRRQELKLARQAVTNKSK